MNCAQVELELVSFHFGELSVEARTVLETHLLDCRTCLQAYLALKRQIETAALEDAPSPALYAKLRRSVAQAVQPPSARAWKWWERPAAFALAGAAMIAALSVLHGVSTAPGRMPHSLEAARTGPPAGP